MMTTIMGQGSWRGITFYIEDAAVSGGRKDVLHEFVGSSRQSIEDLGAKRRAFALNFITHGDSSTTYRLNRDSLASALDQEGIGTLVHPFQGRINGLKCRSWSMAESSMEVGRCTFTANFAFDDGEIVPVPSLNVVSQVTSMANSVVTVAGNAIKELFRVTNTLAGNFEDAIAQVDEFVTAVRESVDFIEVTLEKLDSFNAQLTDLTDDVASLVATPTKLKDSITNIISGMTSLYPTASASFNAFTKLFGFGDNDIENGNTTAINIQRDSNRLVLRNAIQSSALSNAYLMAMNTPFVTTNEIERVSDILQAQFDKLYDGDLDQETMDSLADLRVTAERYFDIKKLSVRRVLKVNLQPTTHRLLSFSHYGDDKSGNRIAELNDEFDPSRMSGEVLILTS